MQGIYSEEIIKIVEEYAGYLMRPEEIAILTGIDRSVMLNHIRDESHEVSKAYYRGKTKTMLAIRKQEVELAIVGSPLAVEHTGKYITEMDISENG